MISPLRGGLAARLVLVAAWTPECFALDPVSVPPAAPQGFSAYPRVSTSWSVELHWIPNSEPDLDHYELDISGDPCESSKHEPYCGLYVVPGTESTYVFHNQNLVQFHWYQFRLRAVNAEGIAGPWSQSIILSSTAAEEEPTLPRSGIALKHSPNPFNASAQIDFTLDSACVVTLRVLDVLGRQVRTLVNGSRAPGVHTVQWAGNVEAGRPVGSGVYLLELATRGERLTTRLLLLK